MDNNQFNAKKVEQLLGMASKKLGVSPNELKNRLQQGDVQHAVPQGKVDMNQFQSIIKDPEKVKQILNTPAAKKLLGQMTEEK
ncbi:hypothetical protein [Zongyangia hominis]|uniref:Uncharacterized protein n=1 Tax=Zongyangia hominis TaxID=2763677 RepID=A0A926I7N9_9FIRM|nr:hypothetical protein [Zongyangia hominis]MBC8571334.1 hypothetical protein [Zongyangia hominis]